MQLNLTRNFRYQEWLLAVEVSDFLRDFRDYQNGVHAKYYKKTHRSTKNIIFNANLNFNSLIMCERNFRLISFILSRESNNKFGLKISTVRPENRLINRQITIS